MFKQIDFEDTAGKAIKAIVRSYSNELIVLFTDSTYSVIGAHETEPGEAELYTHGGLLSVSGDSYERVFKPLFGEHASDIYDKTVLKIQNAEAEEKARVNAIASGHKF